MAGTSKIEWTDKTWNPVAGCSIVSPGCTNCYAMKMAARHAAMSKAQGRPSLYGGVTKASKAGAVWNDRIVVAPSRVIAQPLFWRKAANIFVNSMSDLFHDDVPDEVINWVMTVAYLTPQHTYQILTKRPERARDYLVDPERFMQVVVELMGPLVGEVEEGQDPEWETKLWDQMQRLQDNPQLQSVHDAWPLKNVLIGASVEDQVRADERYGPMAEIAAAGWRTFVSYEPALGPVTWAGWEFLAWLIAGGESGPRSRPPHPEWFRIARDFAGEHGIAFLFKQWGHFKPSPVSAGWPVRFEGGIARERTTVDLEADHSIAWMMDIGKGNAGNVLDGRQHLAFPEVTSG